MASNANGEIPHLVTREVPGQPLAPEEAGACHADFVQQRSLLLTYGAVFALWSMHPELASGDPWPPFFPAQQAVIETLIDAI